jgi:hypothetical protein
VVTLGYPGGSRMLWRVLREVVIVRVSLRTIGTMWREELELVRIEGLRLRWRIWKIPRGSSVRRRSLLGIEMRMTSALLVVHGMAEDLWNNFSILLRNRRP